jgi:hypothetical protein
MNLLIFTLKWLKILVSDLLTPTNVLIFCSFLYNENKISSEKLIELWNEKYSNDLIFIPEFNPLKDYYAPEMGDISYLQRFFVFQKVSVPRSELIVAKLWADNLERIYADKAKRCFNLDIGIISKENLLLATGKSYAHRTYLEQGIYADLTLIYEKNTFKGLSWSYADYSHPEKLKVFNYIRGFLF